MPNHRKQKENNQKKEEKINEIRNNELKYTARILKISTNHWKNR